MISPPWLPPAARTGYQPSAKGLRCFSPLPFPWPFLGLSRCRVLILTLALAKTLQDTCEALVRKVRFCRSNATIQPASKVAKERGRTSHADTEETFSGERDWPLTTPETHTCRKNWARGTPERFSPWGQAALAPSYSGACRGWIVEHGPHCLIASAPPKCLLQLKLFLGTYLLFWLPPFS